MRRGCIFRIALDSFEVFAILLKKYQKEAPISTEYRTKALLSLPINLGIGRGTLEDNMGAAIPIT